MAKPRLVIFQSNYYYTIREQRYDCQGWFVEVDGKRSQPLTWHEAVGTVVQLMQEQDQQVPRYWPESGRHQHVLVEEEAGAEPVAGPQNFDDIPR